MPVVKIFLCLIYVVFLVSHSHAAPQIPPAAPTRVCSAIVYDLDNEAILFEQNADERIPPASLTKILSMFLGLDFIASGQGGLDDNVDISPAAAAVGGSRMGLRAREQVTLRKLLLGMAVSSGNDASHALAEHVGGSADAFVKMMNARCRQLGMKDSNFMNPHGLPAVGQYTTARDMLTLARAYLRAHPQAIDFHNTLVLDHGGNKTWNKNPLLGQYPGADGLKTGWIRASGYNLVFTAARDNRRLLAVILGAPDTYVRSAEACRLLDASFLVCNDQAVSVAAALDSIPMDLTRIDPRKTARDHGLLKPRYVASKSVKGSAGRKSARSGKTIVAKKRVSRTQANLAQNRNARLKAAGASTKYKSKGVVKSHAERSVSSSSRG